MNPRTIIFAVLALAAAGITALLVQGWLENQRMAQPAPQVKPVNQSVLVAKKALPAGRIIRPSDVSWQVWPADGIAENYLVRGRHKSQDLVGAVVRRGIDAHTPITEDGVVKPGDRGFLAAVLTPGYRAVAVPVNASSVIAGLVFPGDRVDLILSYKYEVKRATAKGGADREMRQASETVLSNVRVLALDQNTDDQNGRKGVPKTATLEVTPKQAESVALATQLGRISLSLRSLAAENGKEDTEQKPKREHRDTITRDGEVSRLIGASRGIGGKVIHVMRGGKASAQVIDR